MYRKLLLTTIKNNQLQQNQYSITRENTGDLCVHTKTFDRVTLVSNICSGNIVMNAKKRKFHSFDSTRGANLKQNRASLFSPVETIWFGFKDKRRRREKRKK